LKEIRNEEIDVLEGITRWFTKPFWVTKHIGIVVFDEF